MTVRCPDCGRVQTVADDMAGERVKCECGAEVAIPGVARGSRGAAPGAQPEAAAQRGPAGALPIRPRPAAPVGPSRSEAPLPERPPTPVVEAVAPPPQAELRPPPPVPEPLPVPPPPPMPPASDLFAEGLRQAAPAPQAASVSDLLAEGGAQETPPTPEQRLGGPMPAMPSASPPVLPAAPTPPVAPQAPVGRVIWGTPPQPTPQPPSGMGARLAGLGGAPGPAPVMHPAAGSVPPGFRGVPVLGAGPVTGRPAKAPYQRRANPNPRSVPPRVDD